jgi:hypothetical protein
MANNIDTAERTFAVEITDWSGAVGLEGNVLSVRLFHDIEEAKRYGAHEVKASGMRHHAFLWEL